MNILGMVLGGVIFKNLKGSSSGEIRNLEGQMNSEERVAFHRDYKKLSSDEKKQFKEYLQLSDLTAAGGLVGHNLSNYKVKPAQQPPTEQNQILDVEQQQDPMQIELARAAAFSARIQHILDTGTPEIDPVLVAEAAKRYQTGAIQPSLTDERMEKKLDIVG